MNQREYFFYLAGDIIIKEGTIGSKMYFIQEGIVDVIMGNGEVNCPLFKYFQLSCKFLRDSPSNLIKVSSFHL